MGDKKVAQAIQLQAADHPGQCAAAVGVVHQPIDDHHGQDAG